VVQVAPQITQGIANAPPVNGTDRHGGISHEWILPEATGRRGTLRGPYSTAMTLTPAGLQLLKSLEGCSLEAYPDPPAAPAGASATAWP